MSRTNFILLSLSVATLSSCLLFFYNQMTNEYSNCLPSFLRRVHLRCPFHTSPRALTIRDLRRYQHTQIGNCMPMSAWNAALWIEGSMRASAYRSSTHSSIFLRRRRAMFLVVASNWPGNHFHLIVPETSSVYVSRQ